MQTLCDNFSIIKNGIMRQIAFVLIKRSRMSISIMDILTAYGLIRGYDLYSSKDKVRVFLKYTNEGSVLNTLKAVSKPSRYIYFSFEDICYWGSKSSHSFLILSTSKGVMCSREAMRLGVGGKVLCVVN